VRMILPGDFIVCLSAERFLRTDCSRKSLYGWKPG